VNVDTVVYADWLGLVMYIVDVYEVSVTVTVLLDSRTLGSFAGADWRDLVMNSVVNEVSVTVITSSSGNVVVGMIAVDTDVSTFVWKSVV
jgi:hypothetical protein